MSLETALSRERFVAHQTTLATALSLAFADAGFATIERLLRFDSLEWLYFGHAVICAVVACILWRRPAASQTTILTCFFALALPLLPLFWMIQSRAISDGALWQPFIGRKLMILGIALLTPMVPFAPVALLVVFALEWMLFWTHHRLWHNPVVHAAGEPWVTALYFVAAFVLVGLRARSQRLARMLSEAEAETRALRHLAHASTAVRNHVNTPLQTFEIGLDVLDYRHPEDRRIVDPMRRALQALKALSRSLGEPEPEAHMRSLVETGAALERLEPTSR